MILTIQGTPDLFLDLEPEVTEPAAAGLPLRGSQMNAKLRHPDGLGQFNLFLSSSPSVNYRQHPSEVHARAAYKVRTNRVGEFGAYTNLQLKQDNIQERAVML